MFLRKDKISGYFVLLLLALIQYPAFALQSDRNQPLHVEADRANISKKSGKSVYSGNVVIRQGTLRIQADRIVIHSSNGTLNKIVATGTPATYRQRPDNREQDITARAATMEFDAEKNRAIFAGDAELSQGGNTFRSDRIVYDISNDSVDAGKKTGGDRVIITIQPDKEKKDSPAPKEAP